MNVKRRQFLMFLGAGAVTIAFALSEDNPLKAKTREICQECLIDQGIGVIPPSRNSDGKWARTFSEADRKITGISGWQAGQKSGQ